MKSLGAFSIIRQENVTIHTYMSPVDGDMVCSQIIETPNRLVVVDVQLTRDYAQAVRSYADHLGKPMERVIVTHQHPDHWLGLEYFEDCPLYALPETQYQLQNFGEVIISIKRAQLGEAVSAKKVVPTNLIEDGALETIDGVQFRFTKVTDAEAAVMLMIELPESRTLVAQDMLYNHVYWFVGEKNTQGRYLCDEWIGRLKHLQANDYALMLPGHGEPTDSKVIFVEGIEYVSEARRLFGSGVPEQGFRQALLNKYPAYRVPEMLDLSVLFLYHSTW